MKTIRILWNRDSVKGTIQIINGQFKRHASRQCSEIIDFSMTKQHPLSLDLSEHPDICGSQVTRLIIKSDQGSLTVRTPDISREWPVYLPSLSLILTTGDDTRDYEMIVHEIDEKKQHKELTEIERKPEESYANAARENISLHGPAWLGLGQDMRIFSADLRAQEDDYWAWVEPRWAGKQIELPEANGERIRYQYIMGRGISCVHDFKRSLLNGYLPVLIETIQDKQVKYETKVFVSLEQSDLSEKTNTGTHYLVADRFGAGAYQTEAQILETEKEWQNWQSTEKEETVVYLQTTVTNSDQVPRYAWYKAPRPAYVGDARKRRMPISCTFSDGFGRYCSDRVFSVAKINDRPLTQEEISFLVLPGETVRIEVAIPHLPISEKRALALMEKDFSQLLETCIAYWQNRQSEAASFTVPEKPINDMLKAGPIHLDIATYGSQPEGTLTATIGIYSALGSESWPIILYYDSIGLHGKARRCIQYFYDKQHDSGFMRNFGSYMLETGAVLWVTAEHYAYTNDGVWLQGIMPGIKKACEYLLNWRERNKRDDLRGKGYGLLEGRSSDTPDDASRMYLLNAYTYKGLSCIAQACQKFDQRYWGPIIEEIALYRQDIRDSLLHNLENGPVVPLGDGTWCPTSAPWADGNGPVSLYTDTNNWYTHSSFVTRDSHMNTLTFCNILDPDEDIAELFLHYHCELYFHKNVRPSQPYYARHPYLHLVRGEAKAFIKNYYNALTSLADRETYSFWEHYHHASPHKTHEEGCFLMESRWMLYLEDQDALRLLQGIPRKWLESGKEIVLEHAASYFGSFSLSVSSQSDQGVISARIIFAEPDRQPDTVIIRLPHPEEKKALNLYGGSFARQDECYQMDIENNQGSLVIHYNE